MKNQKITELYKYVFSTEPNSWEREKRLGELTEKQKDDLWDYQMGLGSKGIKENTSETGISFERYKGLRRSTRFSDTCEISKIKRTYPELAAQYDERLEAEEKKREKIFAIKDTAKRQKAIAENLQLFQ